MTIWSDERVLRRPQKEDSLRRRTRDVQKAQAARTFSVSLSSVKRYVQKADRGESLAPKKSPVLFRSWTRRPGSYYRTTSKSAPLQASRTAVTT